MPPPIVTDVDVIAVIIPRLVPSILNTSLPTANIVVASVPSVAIAVAIDAA